jgi:hypothetical protein
MLRYESRSRLDYQSSGDDYNEQYVWFGLIISINE